LIFTGIRLLPDRLGQCPNVVGELNNLAAVSRGKLVVRQRDGVDPAVDVIERSMDLSTAVAPLLNGD